MSRIPTEPTRRALHAVAELVLAGQRVPIDGRTCADLDAAAGLLVGGPAGVYHDGGDANPE